MIHSVELISKIKKEIKDKKLNYHHQLKRSEQLFIHQNRNQKTLYVGTFGLFTVGIGILLAKRSRFIKTLQKTIFFVYT